MYHTLHSLSLDELQATYGTGFFRSTNIVLPRSGRAITRLVFLCLPTAEHSTYRSESLSK